VYHSLNGILIEKTATRIVLDVSGVGYELRIPVSTFAKLPPLGEKVKLLTHFIVREDAHLLFGFSSEEERDFFRLLISVSGIGPKIAITVLSGMSLQELKQAIVKGAVPALTAISGIGKKIAERMIVELREKIALEDMAQPASHEAGDLLIEDSVRALMELGYKKQNAKLAIDKALQELDTSKKNVPELIRKSLKYV
jgi:holliday junction DNA helicase RuvA